MIVGPPSDGKKPELDPYIEFDDESFVQKVVDFAKVDCADKNECPPFVGLFIGKRQTNKIQMYQCSTTYLGDGYFSTNSHCYHRNLSRHSRSFIQNCSDEIWVKMPETGDYEAQTLSCEKVIWLTRIIPRESLELDEDIQQGREEFDVMIFKVKENVNRPKVKINFASPPTLGEELTAWTVNPVLNDAGINGVIEKKTCKTHDYKNKRELLKINNNKSDSIYQNVHIHKCDKNMMKGNSGSTLFNSKLEGVAVFSHIFYAKDGNSSQSDRGYGTKYTCLGDVSDGSKKLFSGGNGNRCRTLSNKDIDLIYKNLEIREHNEVIASVGPIRSKIKEVASSVESMGERRFGQLPKTMI